MGDKLVTICDSFQVAEEFEHCIKNANAAVGVAGFALPEAVVEAR